MNIKKFIKKNQDNVIIIGVSLIAFILGCLAIGWLKSFIIIGIVDAILILPSLLKKKKRKTNTKSYSHTTSNTKKRKRHKKIWKIILILFIICFILGIVGMVAFYLYIAKNAPAFVPKNLYKQESSVIYASDGSEIATLGAENRELVTYDQLPEVLIDAIVATEDSRYFQHSGVDWARFLKASVFQLLGRSDAGGASTLTMQISKNAFTSKDASGIEGIIRKFTDVYISLNKIEKKYSKEEIMEFYVNSYYLGSGAYGVEQAAKTYFGKSVSDINLAEAAVLAGLFQAPGKYDPILNPEDAKKRQTTVLKLMVKHGYITQEEADVALSIDIDKLLVNTERNEDGTTKNQYQAFIDTVVQEIEDKTGKSPYTTSMEIYSTLDKGKQDTINNVMEGDAINWTNEVVTAGVAAIDVKTGALVAVGAGRHRTGERSFNTATMIKRQIGSTSKPLYDYAPEIEYNNWSTYQLLGDEQITYSDGTKINNWDNQYKGLMTARDALAQSRNIPALKAFKANDNSKIKEFVTNLGLHPEIDANGSLHQAHAIGGYTGESPMSMAAAYAAFSNGGYYIEPYSYTKIIYKDTEEVVETKINKTKAMSPETAYMVYDMLKSAANWGLGSQKNINGAEFGAKTGTSNFDDATLKAMGYPGSAINDLWVCGVSPDYAISVWYGYQKNVRGYYTRSSDITHRKIFQKVAQGFFVSGHSVAKPDGVISVTVENETNPALLPSANTPAGMKITELFKKGSEPTEASTRFNTLGNVTNAKASVSNNQLTLSWNAIATPDAINKEKVTALMSSIWENPGNRQSSIDARMNFFGNVIYKIYAKNGNNLSLVTTTSDTKATFKVSSSSATTYVIKSGYSNYGSLDSSGTSVIANLDNVKEDKLTLTLKGEDLVSTTVGKYTDPGCTVTFNGSAVTDATITRTITKEDGTTLTSDSITPSKSSSINFTDIGKYTIKYSVSYKGLTSQDTRNIVIA